MARFRSGLHHHQAWMCLFYFAFVSQVSTVHVPHWWLGATQSLVLPVCFIPALTLAFPWIMAVCHLKVFPCPRCFSCLLLHSSMFTLRLLAVDAALHVSSVPAFSLSEWPLDFLSWFLAICPGQFSIYDLSELHSIGRWNYFRGLSSACLLLHCVSLIMSRSQEQLGLIAGVGSVKCCPRRWWVGKEDLRMRERDVITRCCLCVSDLHYLNDWQISMQTQNLGPSLMLWSDKVFI